MLHLIKLAVGARTLEDLEQGVRGRRRPDGLTSVRTRQFPRRSDEIVAGGSLYWVVAGLLRGRHPIRAIEEARDPDGTRTTAILLDPSIVAVEPRAVRAFQGWRYLAAPDAPSDLRLGAARRGDELPASLRRELAELCLL